MAAASTRARWAPVAAAGPRRRARAPASSSVTRPASELGSAHGLAAPSSDGRRQRHARLVLRRRARSTTRAGDRARPPAGRRGRGDPRRRRRVHRAPAPTRCPPDEELRRVIPVRRGLAGAGPRAVSIDTMKLAVAEAALDAGRELRQRRHRLPPRPRAGGARRRPRRRLLPDAHARRAADDAARPALRRRRRRRQGVPGGADGVRGRRRACRRSGSSSTPGSASARRSSTTSSCCAGSTSWSRSAARS